MAIVSALGEWGSGIPGMLLHVGGDPWGLQLHVDIQIAMIGIAFGYVFAITKIGPRRLPAGERPATPRQLVCFFAGLICLWLVLDGPVHTVAEGYWYSVHMVQHFFLTLIAPPLIILGTPPWLLRILLSPKPVMAVAKILTKPLVALVLFNFVIIVTHLPWVVNLAGSNEFAHAATHGVLIGSAFIMWWPIVSPLPELPAMSYPAKMLYVFAQSLVPTVPASFLTFSTAPLYSFYAELPRLAGVDAVTDQRIGGLVMKLVAGLFLWGILAVIFFKWYQQDEAENAYLLKWPDVERELEDMGLTKR